jgi:hypothetical protein
VLLCLRPGKIATISFLPLPFLNEKKKNNNEKEKKFWGLERLWLPHAIVLRLFWDFKWMGKLSTIC